MKKYIILLLLITSNCLASEWDEYHDKDHFSWTNYDNDVHLLIAYGGTMTLSLLLQKQFKVNPYIAALSSALVLSAVGITKEVMFDRYTSRTDIQCWVVGAFTGGLTFTVLNF